MKLDLDGIETLEAVVETGSFAAAAKRLHKTQSSVSYAIAQMEERLGIEVFDRTGYRAELTEAGRLILEEGRQLLARARGIEALALQFHRGYEPRLDVILDGILPMEPVMQVLKVLGEEEVPTLIQIKVEFLGGVQYRFERDDAHIMLTKDFEAGPEFMAHAMPAVPCMLVAASTHRLFNETEGELELSDLHRYVELTVQDSSESRVKDTRMFGGTRVYYLSDFFTKRQALLMGMGYGWMPMYLVADDLEAARLREVPYVGGSRYEFTPALVHRAQRPLGPTGQRFWELLREIFAV